MESTLDDAVDNNLLYGFFWCTVVLSALLVLRLPLLLLLLLLPVIVVDIILVVVWCWNVFITIWPWILRFGSTNGTILPPPPHRIIECGSGRVVLVAVVVVVYRLWTAGWCWCKWTSRFIMLWRKLWSNEQEEDMLDDRRSVDDPWLVSILPVIMVFDWWDCVWGGYGGDWLIDWFLGGFWFGYVWFRCHFICSYGWMNVWLECGVQSNAARWMIEYSSSQFRLLVDARPNQFCGAKARAFIRPSHRVSCLE